MSTDDAAYRAELAAWLAELKWLATVADAAAGLALYKPEKWEEVEEAVEAIKELAAAGPEGDSQ